MHGNMLIPCLIVLIVASLPSSIEGAKEDDTTPKDTLLAYLSMMETFYREQRVRSEGQSGVKIVRQSTTSDVHNFEVEGHAGDQTAAIHDHSNHKALAGKGQTTVVMNGVEFGTRHDDYQLRMPSTKSSKFEETEEVPFPDVPPHLKNYNKDGQIKSMRPWFKAFKDQDHTKLDYRKHFKPILCYIEGAWYKKKTDGKVHVSTESARHFLDADSWRELNDRMRFVAYSGSKDIAENLALLPTKIIDMVNGLKPVLAQWKYRIMCHPIKEDLPLKHFKVVDDIASRMKMKRTLDQHRDSTAARFVLEDKENDTKDKTILDRLMGEIPGMDNYPGEIFDNIMENDIVNSDKKTKKDISRYHRTYHIRKKDAMGASTIHRGYNDPYMFAASTTQEDIAGIQVKKCKKENGVKKCDYVTQKWTYAIPFEIIYLTPLTKWNPYYIKEVKKPNGDDGKRTGACNTDKALLGYSDKVFYKTPAPFYDGDNEDIYKKTDKAATGGGKQCVLNSSGKMFKVKAAGLYTFLHNIIGVGRIRQRYPIFPVHGEGSSVWKELNAYREANKEKA